MQFRKYAVRIEYDPWKDTLLDLGAPDEIDDDESYARFHESGGVEFANLFKVNTMGKGGREGRGEEFFGLTNGRVDNERGGGNRANTEGRGDNERGKGSWMNDNRGERGGGMNDNGGWESRLMNEEGDEMMDERMRGRGSGMNDNKGGSDERMRGGGRGSERNDNKGGSDERMREGGSENDNRGSMNSGVKYGARDDQESDYMRHTPKEFNEVRSPMRTTPLGERIKYSEVELNDTTPEAFRAFLHKWRIFEKEYQVAWDRTMIHRDVSGFLDLRWREYINESCKFPAQIRGTTWITVQGDRFEEFILWVVEAVEGGTSTGGHQHKGR